MTKLYFLRHGKAYDRQDWDGKDDDLRPLTGEGIELLRQTAQTLRRLDLNLDAIITSPLVRARDTAQLVARELDKVVDESPMLKPGFDHNALIRLIGEHTGAERLLLVGHEPDFSQVISELIGGGAVVMKKGGLARVDITAQTPLRGELVWLLPPDVLTLR